MLTFANLRLTFVPSSTNNGKTLMAKLTMISQVGTELAPLLKHAVTGKPRKDPDTGYMMNHSLGTTDVTRMAVKGHQVGITQYTMVVLLNKHYVKVAGSNNVAARDVYHHQLQGQVAARAETESRDREREAAQQSVHFQVGPRGMSRI